METFVPITGMICCAYDTGSYVYKKDYDELYKKTEAQEKALKEADVLSSEARQLLNHLIDLFLINEDSEGIKQLDEAIDKYNNERHTQNGHYGVREQ